MQSYQSLNCTKSLNVCTHVSMYFFSWVLNQTQAFSRYFSWKKWFFSFQISGGAALERRLWTPSGLSRCCLSVETLLLTCVLNAVQTTQKCSFSSQESQNRMRQTPSCHLYLCKVTLTNEIWGAPAMAPGQFGPVWERSSWALLNDQSLNIAVILLFFLNLLMCLNFFPLLKTFNFFFKLLETCLIPWIKLPPVSHLSFSCSFYIWPSHSLQRKVIKDNTSNR